MNTKQIKELDDKQLSIKIAELIGWKNVQYTCDNEIRGETPNKNHPSFNKWPIAVPIYATDLNAIHEVIPLLTDMQTKLYRNALIGICEGMVNRNWVAIDANAHQRCEALVIALQNG